MAASHPACAQPQLRFLTWNLDGLDDYELLKRTEAACNVVVAEKIDVAVFQEVVDDSLEILLQRLSDFNFLAPAASSSYYYTAICTRRLTCDTSSSSVLHGFYPGTRMERDLLGMEKITLRQSRQSLAVLTSHLESLSQSREERVRQLGLVYEKMQEARSQHDVVVFGGDTNLRGVEVKQCPLPEGIHNAWNYLGRPPESRHTFDAGKNENIIRKGWEGPPIRTQYDKVFFANGQTSARTLRPKAFRLIGKQKLAADSDCVPSDHYGIVCDFD